MHTRDPTEPTDRRGEGDKESFEPFCQGGRIVSGTSRRLEDDGLDLAGQQVFHRDLAVRIPSFEKFCARHRGNFRVAERARLAVDRDLELRAG